MTSPATMWLMGLLLIVGTVALAACGEQGTPSSARSTWDEEAAHALEQYLSGGSPSTLEGLLVTEAEFTHLLSLFEPDLQAKIEGSGGPVVLYRQNSAYILQSLARLQEAASCGEVEVLKVRVEDRTRSTSAAPAAELRIRLTSGEERFDVRVPMVFVGTTDRWVIADPIAFDPEIPSWAKVAPEQLVEARRHGVPVAFENELGMRFVLIPAGTFLMGSPEDERDGGGRTFSDQDPHEDMIARPFYVQITEVSNAEYRRAKPTHDSGVSSYGVNQDGDSQPIVFVTWHHATTFARWLSERERRDYRLPTEAEWERACRAGTQTPFSFGTMITPFDANYDGWFQWGRAGREPGLYRQGTIGTGALGHNAWGAYDMHGNVAEWCQGRIVPSRADWVLLEESHGLHIRMNPGDCSARRGGCWCSSPGRIRSGSRDGYPRDWADAFTGFRLVSPLPKLGE